MSLLFPEKLRIHLAPGIVVVARTKRDTIVQSDARAIAADMDFRGRPLLEALSAMLDTYVDTPSAATVTLSSRIAPMAAMPWRDDLTAPEPQALLSVARFAKSHGGAPADWHGVAVDNGFGQPWVAAGVRQEFVVALKSALAGARVRAAMIAPLAVDLFNAYRARLPARGAAWLLVPEADRLAGWHCQDRVLRECVSLPLPAHGDEPVDALLRREALLRGLPDNAAAWFVTASDPSGPLAAGSVQRLLPRWRCGDGVAAAYPLHWLGGNR